MDITDTTQNRFETGIQLFLEGQSVVYNGVVFWKDCEKVLHIISYSDWNIENINQQMATDKIASAKAVLDELAKRSPIFAEVVRRLPHEHYFCYNYGMGAVALAKEANGEFTWLA